MLRIVIIDWKINKISNCMNLEAEIDLKKRKEQEP